MPLAGAGIPTDSAGGNVIALVVANHKSITGRLARKTPDDHLPTVQQTSSLLLHRLAGRGRNGGYGPDSVPKFSDFTPHLYFTP